MSSQLARPRSSRPSHLTREPAQRFDTDALVDVIRNRSDHNVWDEVVHFLSTDSAYLRASATATIEGGVEAPPTALSQRAVSEGTVDTNAGIFDDDGSLITRDEFLLETESNGERVAVMERQTSVGTTSSHQRTDGSFALHTVLAFGAPLSVVVYVLDLDPDAVFARDRGGLLPLHIACMNRASKEVVEYLIQKYPESATDPFNAAQGLTVLHVAAATGASADVVRVLAAANDRALSRPDRVGRTPLHLAMANSTSTTEAVKALIEMIPQQVNERDNQGHIPIRCLSIKRYEDEDKFDERERLSVIECLHTYLGCEECAYSAEFLVALDRLPHWIRDHALLRTDVQDMLNKKMSLPFPMMFLLLDFVLLILLLVSYRGLVYNAIDAGSGGLTFDTISIYYLVQATICLVYFFIREVLQILSMASLGVLGDWFGGFINWVDVAMIVCVLSTILRVLPSGNYNIATLRSFAAITTGLIWGEIIHFLTVILIDFAVFVVGLFKVIRTLINFTIVTGLILCAFSQMFFTVFQNTAICAEETTEMKEDGGNPLFYCTWSDSLVKVYGMLVGDVQVDDFASSDISKWLFVVFGFVIIVVLLSVVIAIVTDCYTVIQNERAELEFWQNRLSFLTETNAGNTFCFRKCIGITRENERWQETEYNFGRETWEKCIMILSDSIDWNAENNYREPFHVVLLGAAACVVVGCCLVVWLIFGFISAGWLWPPQVREHLVMWTMRGRRRKDEPTTKRTAEETVQGSVDMRKRLDAVNEQVQELRSDIREIKSALEMILAQEAQAR